MAVDDLGMFGGDIDPWIHSRYEPSSLAGVYRIRVQMQPGSLCEMIQNQVQKQFVHADACGIDAFCPLDHLEGARQHQVLLAEIKIGLCGRHAFSDRLQFCVVERYEFRCECWEVPEQF